jgi:hypothetical protein
MGQHALHGQMGLAGIGGAQHGGYIADLRHVTKVDPNWAMSTGCGAFPKMYQFGSDAQDLDSMQNEA